jgi:outer membrane protein OmpA-like peptidoglycan-associated protein/osmotically-inducible protein OsmY
MTAWSEWLVPGLFVTFWLTVAAWLGGVGVVEDRLAQRIATELRAEGHDWVEVTVSGRVALIGGTSENDAARTMALAAAERIGGVRSVTDATALLTLASPFEWRAVRSAKTVTLTGVRPPGEEPRTFLAEAMAARFAGFEVDDRTLPARGAPPEFLTAADYLLDALTLLAEGEVSLRDGRISIAGLATDSAAFEGASSLIQGSAPSGFTLGEMEIAPPFADPFWIEATMSGGEIVLAGTILDEGMRGDLRARADQAWGARGDIVDRMGLASGGRPEFAEAAWFAIGQAARLAEGRVRLVGPALTIEGIAASIADYDALAALRDTPMPAGIVLATASVAPAVASPYFWRGERNAGVVVLTGYMPSEETKSEVVAAAAAAMPGLTISDHLRVATGAPRMDWVGAAEFALQQLARLGQGAVVVSEHTLSVEGAAADAEAVGAFEALRAATLPASLTLARAEIAAPIVSPYRTTLRAEEGELVIEGYLPDPATRALLMAAAAERFGEGATTDRAEIASGAPDGLGRALVAGLDAVTRANRGHVEIVDRTIRVEGEGRFPGAPALITEALAAAAGSGFNVVDELDVAPLGEPLATVDCQALVNEALAAGQVQFPAGETNILPASYALLDRMVALLLRCPATLVEVGGHTDADGAASYNRSVSMDRAGSVVAYLVAGGVVESRLTAMGYGESQPIAGNATPEEKARNRRIELTLRDPAP